ncbi:putative carboxylesterase, type B, carboxylesterase type B, carboxylesterase type B, active [Septoria linicola]|nr:putative carboxylesterase, type B, carboxylesterase type B, carboxylesterase type B, active [Septoria linicola]
MAKLSLSYYLFLLSATTAHAARQSNGILTDLREKSETGSCTEDGVIMCKGSNSFGQCNRGSVTWMPTAAGTCCKEGKIDYCKDTESSTPSDSPATQTTSPSVSSCYNGGGPTVTLEVGVVEGTTTSLPAATAAVNKYLGIPFADPPTRFAPPERAQAAGQKINATAFKPACIQQFAGSDLVAGFTKAVFNNPGGVPPEESEDCLYLNIYAPSTPAPCDGRAVLFWLYGGSLQFGNAGQPFYDGSSFAAYEDVIVVTVNYRTNVFGFATSPELPITEQNLGFLDQRAALDWVQREIHLFGGSPDKVTIFGESAGGWSVDALLTSYNKGDQVPFRGAILESGQISFNAQPRPSTYPQWDQLATALNCSTSYGSNLECIRAANATVIKSIIEKQSLEFNPTFDNKTFFVNAAQRRADGVIPSIPVLGGTNSQEGRIFNVAQNSSTAFLEQITANTSSLIDAISNAYPLSGFDSGPTPYDQLSQIFTEYVFQCTAGLWANASAAAGIPTWQYYYNASFSNTQPVPGIQALGAYHSSEIPLVFGTYPRVNVTVQEYALSAAIQGAWARFAKNPAGGPGWNPVGSGSPDQVLGAARGIGPAGAISVDGGIYLGANETTVGNLNMAVLGTRGDVLGSGVTVIDSEEVNYRCGLFAPTYSAVAAMDRATAAGLTGGM